MKKQNKELYGKMPKDMVRMLSEIKLKNAQMAAQFLGSIKSEAKAKASRENGKKGGYHKNFKKK